MSTAPVYSSTGSKMSSIQLNPSVFNVQESQQLLKQIVLGYLKNQSSATAHTKTRGEVSGGGKKPFRQKGTGRARAGSIRSPLWRGGGTVFGPRSNPSKSKRIPRKMRQAALRMILTQKLKANKLVITADQKFDKPKTAAALQFFSSLPIENGNLLVIEQQLNPGFALSVRNLAFVTYASVAHLNALHLLNSDWVIINQSAIQTLNTTLGSTKAASTIDKVRDDMTSQPSKDKR